MRSLFAICVALGVTVAGIAQTPAPADRFEVASVKPATDCGQSRGMSDSTPGRLTVDCQTLKGLVMTAYIVFANGRLNPDMPPPEIEGGPGWVSADRFAIAAKAAGNPRREVMRGPMLQALLEDRFKLKTHFETRGEAPLYVITAAKTGPKLRPFREGSCVPVESTSSLPDPLVPEEKRCSGSLVRGTEPNTAVLDVKGATLDQLANMLRYALFSAVVDKSGISGRFDIHLDFAYDPESPFFMPDGASGPTLPAALEKQLGLKLERGKAPRQVLVIDHAERPSEN